MATKICEKLCGKNKMKMSFVENMEAVILLVFMVVNWLLYHCVFSVRYFGGAGKSIFREFLVSFIVAILELALLIRFPVILVILVVIVVVMIFAKNK